MIMGLARRGRRRGRCGGHWHRGIPSSKWS